MYRRAFSYDDALEDPAPMTPPPADMGSIPWKPVMPERKYQHLAQVPAPPSVDCPQQTPPPPSPPQPGEPQWLQAAASPCEFSVPQLESAGLFYYLIQTGMVTSSTRVSSVLLPPPRPTSQCPTQAPWPGSARSRAGLRCPRWSSPVRCLISRASQGVWCLQVWASAAPLPGACVYSPRPGLLCVLPPRGLTDGPVRP